MIKEYTAFYKYRCHIYKAWFLLILSFAVSCGEDDITGDNSSVPVITKIEPRPAYYGDAMIITGKGFGALNDSGSVYLNDKRLISYDCIRWDNGSIQFIIPYGILSGKIWVETKNGKSNEYQLTIGAFPPFEMITVPAGEFMMGSDVGFDNEKPVHRVVITKSFEISKYEILRSIWQAVFDIDSCTFIYRDLPANNMSWISAIRFCNKISVLSGFDSCYVIDGNNVIWDKSANGYRLPTEAEWEYACRAGTAGDFSGSGIVDEMGWYNTNSGQRCLPPGTKKPNAFGIYDMHGNVWEWCWDNYDENYYSTAPQNDPSGPGSGTRKVLRGGSFINGITALRSSNRTYNLTENTFNGIRVVRNKFE